MTFDQQLKRNNHFKFVGKTDIFVVAISGEILPEQCCVKITQPHLAFFQIPDVR